MEKDYKTIFAERFGDLMKKLSVSPYEMAETLEIKSPQKIYNILNAKYYPNFEMLLIISKKFDINLHWLITGEGEIFISQKNAPQNAPSNAPQTPEINNNLTSVLEKTDKYIEAFLLQLKEKDEQLRTKDAQIEAKDLQINNLIETLKQEKASDNPRFSAGEAAARGEAV